MSELFAACSCFGLILPLATYQLARVINQRTEKELCNPLLFSTVCCCVVLLLTGTEYDVFYENGGGILEFFLTPATICLAIPLYRQFHLLRCNV